jgi:hypothetical protein
MKKTHLYPSEQRCVQKQNAWAIHRSPHNRIYTRFNKHCRSISQDEANNLDENNRQHDIGVYTHDDKWNTKRIVGRRSQQRLSKISVTT